MLWELFLFLLWGIVCKRINEVPFYKWRFKQVKKEQRKRGERTQGCMAGRNRLGIIKHITTGQEILQYLSSRFTLQCFRFHSGRSNRILGGVLPEQDRHI